MRRLVTPYALAFFLMILVPVTLTSQITTSPYSIFGLGILEGNSSGLSRAMGGTNIAFLSENAINYGNPASYDGLDSLLTIFEIGVFSKYSMFQTSHNNQSLLNANFRYMSMGFRIAPWLSTSFGFTPYSSVGYRINSTAFLEGTSIEYPKTYIGNGGVNRVYLGGAVSFIKNLSLGVNASYLFGDITHIEASEIYEFSLEDITYLSNFTFNYGLNYQVDVNDWKYNVGFIYSDGKKLNTRNTTTIETKYEKEVLKSRKYRYSIPRTVGAGLSVRKDFFKAGVDYEWSNWEEVDFSSTYLHTRNSNRISAGVEFPSQGLRKGSSRMILFRFGGEFRESYMVIKGVPIDYRAVSMGLGLPLKGVVSVVNATLEFGQNGTMKRDLFRENFVTLSLDLSLRDLWFRKRQYN